MLHRSSKSTNSSQTAKTRRRSTGKCTFDQEKKLYYSFLGISTPFPPRSRGQQNRDKSGDCLDVTFPSLTSSGKNASISKSSILQETFILRKQSKETKKLLTELDKDVSPSQPAEGPGEKTITELPERTPEPEILRDFPELRIGTASKPERMRRHSSYEPRYCWCTRCQIMYRMYKENDNSLEGWGNYPCFHL